MPSSWACVFHGFRTVSPGFSDTSRRRPRSGRREGWFTPCDSPPLGAGRVVCHVGGRGRWSRSRRVIGVSPVPSRASWGICRGRSRGGRSIGRLFRCPPARIAPQLQAMGAVDETVEDGVGDRGVAQRLVPVTDRQLAGDDGRAGARAVLDDLHRTVQSRDGGQPAVERRQGTPEDLGRRDVERVSGATAVAQLPRSGQEQPIAGDDASRSADQVRGARTRRPARRAAAAWRSS